MKDIIQALVILKRAGIKDPLSYLGIERLVFGGTDQNNNLENGKSNE